MPVSAIFENIEAGASIDDILAWFEGLDRTQVEAVLEFVARNSDLLNAAEAAGFDVLITTDKNLSYQQNLTLRKIAIIVLLKQQWPDLRRHVHLVVAAIDAATPGAYTEVEIP